jgi:hypothetical protein
VRRLVDRRPRFVRRPPVMPAGPATPTEAGALGGEVFCFEVNPCPAFSFYESNTGQPIAASLARYLAADSM